jgi:Flp pilus assembly pilin Flp
LPSRRSLVADRSGAAAVEYGLLIAALAGAILFVIFVLGNMLNKAGERVARQQGEGTDVGRDGGSFIHTNPDAG